MNIHPDVVGIDVSKARLDIFDGAACACANTAEAIAPLARTWAGRGALVVYEATGIYDGRLRRALDAAGVRHAGRPSKFNPSRGVEHRAETGRASGERRLIRAAEAQRRASRPPAPPSAGLDTAA